MLLLPLLIPTLGHADSWNATISAEIDAAANEVNNISSNAQLQQGIQEVVTGVDNVIANMRNVLTQMEALSQGSSTDNLYGGFNSGGHTVYNYGDVGWSVYGSYNDAASANGGSNLVVNTGTGTIGWGLFGSYNLGGGSQGNGNSITNSGGLGWSLCGSYNEGALTSGGSNYILNDSGIGWSLYGSYNEGAGSSGGDNTIINNKAVGWSIYGSNNQGDGSSGGDNSIVNSSGIGWSIYGSYNYGASSSGGSNSITSTKAVGWGIYGSDNQGDSSSGGDNYINNNSGVGWTIYGSYNYGNNSNGGGNTIINGQDGTVGYAIIGSWNYGADTTGQNNTVENYGEVKGSIYGSLNDGANSLGGGNTIKNYGVVTGSIYGSQDNATGSSSTGNSILNAGTVGGSIFAGSGDDTVTVGKGSSVSGTVDGQGGTDVLAFRNAGTVNGNQYVNFEELDVRAGSTTLTGSLVIDGAARMVDGWLTIGSGAQLQADTVLSNKLAVVLDEAGTTPLVVLTSGTCSGNLVVDAPASVLTGNLIVADGPFTTFFDSVSSANPNMSNFSLTNVGNQWFVSNGEFTPQWDNSALGLASTMASNLAILQLPGQRSLQIMTDNKEQEPVMVASAGPMYDLIPKSEDKRYGMYLQPLYAISTRDAFNGAPGYTATTKGIEVGADVHVDDSLLLGAFASYASAYIDVGGVTFAENDSEEQQLYALGLYGGYKMDDWVFTDTLGFTHAENESRRNAGLGQTARGEYTTQLLTNRFLAGYVFSLDGAWEIAPELGLNANYMHRGAFSETDAVNAQNYGTFNDFFAESVIGLRIRKNNELNGIQYAPYARASWAHDLLGNDVSVRQSLGSSTALVTQKNDDDHFNLDLGISARKDNTMLSLSFGGGVSDHSHSLGGLANLRYEF